jgi:hypothetical protein
MSEDPDQDHELTPQAELLVISKIKDTAGLLVSQIHE